MDSEHKQILENQLIMSREALANESWDYMLSQLELACRVIEKNTDASRDNDI